MKVKKMSDTYKISKELEDLLKKDTIKNEFSKINEQNKDKVKEVAEVLYDQACLIEGFAIKDPIAYSKKICELLVK